MLQSSVLLSLLLSSITSIHNVDAAAIPQPQISKLDAGSSFKVPVKARNARRNLSFELPHALNRAGGDRRSVEKRQLFSLLADVPKKLASQFTVPPQLGPSVAVSTSRRVITVLPTPTSDQPLARPDSADLQAQNVEDVVSEPPSPSLASSGTTIATAIAIEAINQDTWIEQLQVGSPPVNMAVSFDTGSSDMWFYNAAYSMQKDTSYNNQDGQTWDIRYGDNSTASGIAGQSRVAVGNVVADHQAIAVVTDLNDISPEMREQLDEDQMNGYVGLAFPEVSVFSPTRQPSFFGSIQKNLAEPLFTVDLVDGGSGTFTFGSLNPNGFAGDQMHWSSLNKEQGRGRWAVDSSDIYISINGEAPIQAENEAVTVIDTGTTLILLNEKTVTDYYTSGSMKGVAYQDSSTISGDAYWTFPCNVDPPALSIGFQGLQIPVNNIYASSRDGSQCAGSLQATSPGGRQLLGDMFLRSAVVAFHAGNSSIGIAPKTAASTMDKSVLGSGTV